MERACARTRHTSSKHGSVWQTAFVQVSYHSLAEVDSRGNAYEFSRGEARLPPGTHPKMLRKLFSTGNEWVRRLRRWIAGSARSSRTVEEVETEPHRGHDAVRQEAKPIGEPSPPRLPPSGAPPPDGESTRDGGGEVEGHDHNTDGELASPQQAEGSHGTKATTPETHQEDQNGSTQTQDGNQADKETDERRGSTTRREGKGSSPSHDLSDDGGSTPDGEVDSEVHGRKEDAERSVGPKRREPREIRGRRSGPAQTTPVERPSPKPRPELICRRPPGSVQWEVVISTEIPVAAVKQNGQLLKPGSGGWPIASLDGHLSIDLEEGSRIHVLLFDGSPMIFKLNKNWSGEGRRVTRLTKGYFIVIAPAEWVRSGPEPHEPDGCYDSAFMAHYFFRDASEFQEGLGGFVEHEIDSSTPGFQLSGMRVFDDSDQGILFAGPDAPRLNTADRVVWVRVGEEDRDGWKGRNFRPSETLTDVLNGRQGRFFVRVYDEQIAMLDSGEFRYLRGLREIRVNGERYAEDTLLVPAATGHPPTTIRFVGIDDVRVGVVPSSGTMRVEDEKSSLIVEAHPDADEVRCEVEADGDRIDVVLQLPRVWWRMEGNGIEGAGEWRSTPFDMGRDEFQDVAHLGTAVRLRLPKRVTSVSVGFGDEPGRKYAKKDDDIVLPMSHFVDHDEIDHHLIEEAVLNVRLGGSKDRRRQKRVTVIRVRADPRPTIESFRGEPGAIVAGQKSLLSWVTRHADDVRVVIDPDIGEVESVGNHEITPSETGVYTLRITVPGMKDVTRRIIVQVQRERHSIDTPVAKVRRVGGGWRSGKGFSQREVRAADHPASRFRLERSVWYEEGKRVPKGTIVELRWMNKESRRGVARLSYRGKHIVTCFANELCQYGRSLSNVRVTEERRRSISIDRRRRSKHPNNIETLRKQTDD